MPPSVFYFPAKYFQPAPTADCALSHHISAAINAVLPNITGFSQQFFFNRSLPIIYQEMPNGLSVRSRHSNALWIKKKRPPCRFIPAFKQQLLPPQFSPFYVSFVLKKKVRCLIIQTKQRCRSAWVCFCPGAASALASSIGSTVLDFSVFDRSKGMEKKIHVLCLFPVFVRLVKQPTEMHNCAIVCVHRDLQTYWRMRGDFASQPQPTCVKAQRKKTEQT